MMLVNGRGGDKDDVSGLMWLQLAANQGHVAAAELVEKLKKMPILMGPILSLWQILLLGGEELIEIPLTVSPRIDLAGLVVKPTEVMPKVDLDGDGELTWRDDYILVANLLGREQKSTFDRGEP